MLVVRVDSDLDLCRGEGREAGIGLQELLKTGMYALLIPEAFDYILRELIFVDRTSDHSYLFGCSVL